jgi:hypothetical protein
MRALTCPTDGVPLFFENDICLTCGTSVAFDPVSFRMVAVEHDAGWTWCDNRVTARCNWAVREPGQLCTSCELTRTRPDEGDLEAVERFVESEAAKRRLVAQLLDIGLPVESFRDDPDHGLGFDLLSGRFDPDVMIGHEDGLITLDVDEADDAHRERVRADLGEAYRTMLGHLRHEVGHYYWMVLVERGGPLDEFRQRFGDERVSYSDAISSHYGGGGPTGWEETHVSAYAIMHPWEDWAETFAHYLHMRDTVQTATELGVTVTERHPARSGEVPTEAVEDGPFPELVREWIALAGALNMLNRSMGASDLYPFVLAPAVVDKLGFVDRLVRARASTSTTS